MARYLLATASVHVTAAAADHLQDRLDPDADELRVVGVREPDAPGRDVGDAANVARSRLAALVPTVDLRDGDPTDELAAAIDEWAPDVVVIGRNDGSRGSSGLGSVATVLLESAAVPVVVVPVVDGA